MAEGMNKVLLLGNLGADPELRVTTSGQSVLGMRVATSSSFLDRNNARQERTEWHSITLWGKRGEALSKFLRKGERIFIEGEMRTDQWEKDGEKKYRTYVVARNVYLAGRPKGHGDQPSSSQNGRGQGYQGPQSAPPPSPQDGSGGFAGEDPPIDDIPF